jgi:hypothetical protein
MGWDRLVNGDLLHAAENAAFDLVLTTDQGIRYQQNLTGRRIAIVVLTGTTKWSQVRVYFERVAAAVQTARAGSYAEVSIPFTVRKAYIRPQHSPEVIEE